MVVQVQFFGHYSSYYPGQPLVVSLKPGARVADLATVLAEQDPRLAGLTGSCRFAVDEEYASLDCELSDGATVAVLPPMSGG